LNAYDLRCPTESPQLKWKNNSQFAGVTSLLSFKGKEFMLASGSYDERMRIIDTRLPKSSVSDLNLKGGIWRMRVNPWNENKILVACMYHNFSFVDMDEKFSLSLADKFEEHSSICYGCDWSYKQGMKGEQYFATCSFYDHKMCICSVESK
jgi:diphthine methyl ester acylhydrolase